MYESIVSMVSCMLPGYVLLRCLLKPYRAGGYAAVQCSNRVGVFNHISSTVWGVVWSWQCLCLLCCRSFTQTAHYRKATKTCPAAKWYWRPLNSKRSLHVLKWTSESEHFLSFNFFFFQNLYIIFYLVQERSLDPSLRMVITV